MKISACHHPHFVEFIDIIRKVTGTVLKSSFYGCFFLRFQIKKTLRNLSGSSQDIFIKINKGDASRKRDGIYMPTKWGL
jgi:hypothetical protein